MKAINPTAGPLPAIEIGGTHVSGALVDTARWRVSEAGQLREPIDSNGTAESIIAGVVECATKVGPSPGSTWGFAIPGPFDYEHGIGRFRGVAKFEALDGFDFGAALKDGLGGLAGEIHFLNDADAFLVGEAIAGAGIGHQRIVGVTVGTGVGSAFLADRVIVDDGPLVPPLGNVHLLEIDGSPLEDTVSRRAIRKRFLALDDEEIERPDVEEIARLARAGNETAANVFRNAFAALGLALAPWLDNFEASALVVGGSIAKSWDLLQLPLQDGLQRYGRDLVDRVSVLPAELPAEAALIGAAWHAGEILASNVSG